MYHFVLDYWLFSVYVQVLPSLLEVMHDIRSRESSAISLICLQFIYWSMLQLDSAAHGAQVWYISTFSEAMCLIVHKQ